MKNILLNVLAFVAFLAIEIVAVAFMSTYPAGSAAMMLLGLLALVIGGAPRQRHSKPQALINRFSICYLSFISVFSPWFPGVTASR